VTERDDAEYWEDQLDEQRRTGLKSIRETAGKWQGTIAGLLGAFGLASVVKGPSTFKDLGFSESDSAALLVWISVAALLAFGAILCSAFAAQGTPQIRRNWTGENLKNWTHDATEGAVILLGLGRWLTVVAALIVLVVSVLVPAIAIAQTKPAPLKAIVDLGNGQLACGVLFDTADLKINVGGQIFDLTSNDDVKIVDRCPE
jgi:hypothetical protein